MRRAVVFAHYDRDNIVDDYVIFYLKALREVASEVIFVSCCNLPQNEISKLDGIASYVIAEKHEEYDFGSYKRGYLYLKEKLTEFDELVFANDSCFGPLHSFKNIFDEMDTKDCDFWGITKNNFSIKKNFKIFLAREPHIQSYFIVLRKKVLESNVFESFMQSIQKEDDKSQVIMKYEVGLSQILLKNGFKFKVYINVYGRISNIAIHKWRQLILKHKMPLLKCSLPRLVNLASTTVEGYQDIIKQKCDYPIELIENNVNRTKSPSAKEVACPLFLKRFFFDLATEVPYVLKKVILFILKLFNIMNKHLSKKNAP